MLNLRSVSLYGGVIVVSLWTYIRHITNGVNFDIVGQIGVAEQWVHGIGSGVVLGQTNYLLKMPLYILVNALHFISPMNRILLLALVFDITTFVVIFVLFEKILKLYGVKDHSWLYISMLWLATISGNVYWLEYANSRNLETAGGILLLYMVMKYLKFDRTNLAILVALVASLIFFADTLQLYVCGGGVCIYVIGRWLWHRNNHNFKHMAAMLGAIIGGFIGSRILASISKAILPVRYLNTPNAHPALTFHNAVHAIRGAVVSIVDIFGANFLKHPYSPNNVREFLDFMVTLCLAIFIVRLVFRGSKQRPPFGLLLSIIVASLIAYIASGQVLQANTSRYLIMVPLLTVIIVALFAPRSPKLKKHRWQQVWLCVLGASTIILFGALIKSWPDKHSKDQHIYQTVAYLHQSKYKYALGTHDLGVTTTYFAGEHEVVLPVSCPANHTIHAINLFYDKGAFNLLRNYIGEVPVIVSTGGSGINLCNQANIFAALGAPKRQQIIPDVGTVEIYNATSIKIIN